MKPHPYEVKNNHLLFLNGPFSNFHHSFFYYRNQKFSSSEAAFMYAKALEFNDQVSATKLLNTTLKPYEAKAIGREVKGFNNTVWDKVRYLRMLEVLREKFKNHVLRNILLSTGNTVLTECNPRDNIWAVGWSTKDPEAYDQSKWKGQNLLGKALMEVRDEIRKEIS